jgi:hypothetical protein
MVLEMTNPTELLQQFAPLMAQIAPYITTLAGGTTLIRNIKDMLPKAAPLIDAVQAEPENAQAQQNLTDALENESHKTLTALLPLVQQLQQAMPLYQNTGSGTQNINTGSGQQMNQQGNHNTQIGNQYNYAAPPEKKN